MKTLRLLWKWALWYVHMAGKWHAYCQFIWNHSIRYWDNLSEISNPHKFNRNLSKNIRNLSNCIINSYTFEKNFWQFIRILSGFKLKMSWPITHWQLTKNVILFFFCSFFGFSSYWISSKYFKVSEKLFNILRSVADLQTFAKSQ